MSQSLTGTEFDYLCYNTHTRDNPFLHMSVTTRDRKQLKRDLVFHDKISRVPFFLFNPYSKTGFNSHVRFDHRS